MSDDICKPTFVKYFLREYKKIDTKSVDSILQKISYTLRDRWVASKCSDFSIYNDPDYIFDMAHCYFQFTRQSVSKTKKVIPDLASILDYYNGVGLSTIQAATLWPDSEIYFFNDVKAQVDFMRRYCERFRFFKKEIKHFKKMKYDAVFVFEVFEHMDNPEKFFIEKIKPHIKKYLVFTAPFSEMWGGHFYKYCGVDSKNYKKRFKNFLFKNGFIEIFSGFNERPLIYENICQRADV